ncbi:hypothetical protein NDU88_006944 [Pleurodeles waltl]|uniref:Uncharacterized protein n=1 Tax=Pleurodeles waltl TaxID=8319 RepID=A0AAV7MDP6_PLEWA|nr:hypothetical protein NDU88_006944 [Pleurodeles waltl]
MSKRLKLQFRDESEMAEHSFNNPYPDYEAVLLDPEEGGPEQDLSAGDQDVKFDKDGKMYTALRVLANVVRAIPRGKHANPCITCR